MYEAFYELARRPFLTVPDPAFIYWSEGHEFAFTTLRYGLMSRAPITVVTGDIGAGKTTLVRRLLSEIPEDLTVGLVSNAQPGRGELLQWVMMALGQGVHDEPYVRLFERFQSFVVDAYAARRRVVLIFDEAQNLGVDMLEELRMFSNINADGDELLQIVLTGQPQLRDLLRRPELKQFAQRISSDFHLTPLSAKDTQNYILCRLDIAGARWRIFVPRACELIHEATGGVPRSINILCDLCLVYGYAAESKVVDEGLVQEFLSEARKRGIYEQFSAHAETLRVVRRTQ